MPMLTATREKGQPDVVPEAWIRPVRQPLDAAVAEGKRHYAARSPTDGGVEGWWIPKYVADANPAIKTVDDALKYPELFPRWKTRAGVRCTTARRAGAAPSPPTTPSRPGVAQRKIFVLLDTGSAAGLDGSIAKACERKEGWLGQCCAPTAVLGRYEMVKLDVGVPHHKAAFETCNAQANCDKPTKTDWARAEVSIVVTDRFQKEGDPAVT